MAYEKFSVGIGLQLTGCFLLFSWMLNSQVIAQDWRRIDPGPHAQIKAGFSYIDNVFRKDEDRKSDFLFVAAPDLWWKGYFGKHFLVARYEGEYGTFFSHEEQDYNDHAASADLGFDFTEKFNVDLGASYVKSHDRPQEPGTSLDDFVSPTRWHERKVQGRFTYGRRRLGAAEIGLSLYGKQRRYSNNHRVVRDSNGNVVQEIPDRDRDGLGVTLDYEQPLLPNTRLLTQFRYNKSDFNQLGADEINQDNEGYSFWLGGSWAGTANSTAKLLLAYVRQTTDSPSLKNFSGVGVEAELEWKLKPNSSIIVEALRTPKESDDRSSGFFLSNRLGIEWRHDFEDFIRFNSGIGYRYDDFNSQDRIDKFVLANVGLSYSWTEYAELGCEYRFTYRDSSLPGRDYRVNLVNLFIKISPTF